MLMNISRKFSELALAGSASTNNVAKTTSWCDWSGNGTLMGHNNHSMWYPKHQMWYPKQLDGIFSALVIDEIQLKVRSFNG